jgi:hypothetical protein
MDNLTTARALQGFKETIIPGIFKVSFNELLKEQGFEGIIKISDIFSKYVEGLETKEFISPKQSQELDLLWVKEIQKFEI